MKLNRSSIAIGIIFSICFIILSLLYYDFVLDDAFIIYRYSLNLAHGDGIVWNPGGDPVEGFTSFLWVVLNSLSIKINVDPVIFSKIISSVSSIALIWMFIITGRKTDLTVAALFAVSFALNPQFAFLSMQGMETYFTTIIISIISLLSIKIIERPILKNISLIYLFVFMALLSRPDTAAFSFGVLLSILAVHIYRKDYRTIRMLIITGIVFSVAVFIYVLWRYIYFGYLFPNTFYIKLYTGDRIFSIDGIIYIKDFLLEFSVPYLILIAVLLIRYHDRPKLVKIYPILIGCIIFGIYILTIKPLQGFMGRFIFPVYPAFLIGFLYYFAESDKLKFKGKVIPIFLLMFFIFWNLKSLPYTFNQKRVRTQYDRAMAGKKLSGLPGRMFTTEAGALPYYSGWISLDSFGFNSEEIAHNGLSREILESLEPDLIMLGDKPGKYDGDVSIEYKIINQYMIDNEFVAVAAVQKYKGKYHYYFVRKNSDLFDEIVRRLLSIETIEYADMEELITEKRIIIYKQERE